MSDFADLIARAVHPGMTREEREAEPGFSGTPVVRLKVPDDVDAVTMSGEPGRDVTAAVVVTAKVKGDAAGTLISTLSPVADAQALAERRIRLG